MPYELSRRLGAGPLLCDGAMGTLLYARGISLDACFDVLNLNNPRVVQSIHAGYIAAGADCIETNTFGANPLKLATHAPDTQVPELNRRQVAPAPDAPESSGRAAFACGARAAGRCARGELLRRLAHALRGTRADAPRGGKLAALHPAQRRPAEPDR